MWTQVSEARYDEMMGVVPPAVMLSYGFLVGEPNDHRACTVTGAVRAEYAAFVVKGGQFYEGPNLTASEFRKLDLDTVK